MSLSGHIPTSIGALDSLTELVLKHNSLTGSLPQELCNAKHMFLIDVSWNEFEEYIPQCFESLVELRLIVLESNKLSGPLFNTTPLVLLNTLIVTDNKLSGSLPISQMGWSDESTLYGYFGSNSFSGRLDDESCSAQNHIVFLDLSNNLFTGSIPSSISKIMSLEYLLLNGNKFTGDIPDAWGDFNILRQLNIGANELQGTLPALLGSLNTLSSLQLSGNYFTGPLLASLFNTDSMTAVEHIDCSDNYLSGSLPQQYNGINITTSLMYLNISNNLFTGSIVSTITSLNGLLFLDVSYNHLSGTIPAEMCNRALGNMPDQLFEFIASNNLLWSTLPNCMGNMSLFLLDLSFNHLTGQLDSSLGNLREVESLLLNSNFFSNQIPDVLFSSFISNYPENQLSVIDFSDNIFSGTIPSSLFTLTSLHALSLSSNCFTGEFPSR